MSSRAQRGTFKATGKVPLAALGMTILPSLPLAHHLGAHRLRDLVDIRHLEDARRHEDDLAAAHQVAAAEAEIDGPPGNARGALEPLSKLGAPHELGPQRYLRMGPPDPGAQP